MVDEKQVSPQQMRKQRVERLDEAFEYFRKPGRLDWSATQRQIITYLATYFGDNDLMSRSAALDYAKITYGRLLKDRNVKNTK